MDGRLGIAELACRLGVAEITARRDLDAMAAEGLVVRDRGGATLTPIGRAGAEYAGRLETNGEEKVRIGRAAAALIRPGNSVIIDTGTTALRFAEALADRNPSGVRVVTSSLMAIQALRAADQLEVFVPGGIFRPDRMILSGPPAEEALSRYAADFAVLSVDGITAEHGLMTVNAEAARLGVLMVAAAERAMVLADHSKVGRRAFVEFAGIGEVDTLLTGVETPEDALSAIATCGIEIRKV